MRRRVRRTVLAVPVLLLLGAGGSHCQSSTTTSLPHRLEDGIVEPIHPVIPKETGVVSCRLPEDLPAAELSEFCRPGDEEPKLLHDEEYDGDNKIDRNSYYDSGGMAESSGEGSGLDNSDPHSDAMDDKQEGEGASGVDSDYEEVNGDEDDYYYEGDDVDDDDAIPKGGTNGLPKDYSQMTVNDMWYHAFDCDTVFQQVRPIHNHSTWTFLRGVYLGVMITATHRDASSTGWLRHQDHPGRPTIDRRAPLGSGFRKAVQAKQTGDGKGRGVYAAELIRKGELVWTATSSTARFPTGALYRQFLAIIPHDLACDVLQWAYVQDVSHFQHFMESRRNDNLHKASCGDSSTCEGAAKFHPVSSGTSVPMLRVSVDLDEGSYMNSEDYEPNVGCLPPKDATTTEDTPGAPQPLSTSSHCQQNFYALRDIQVDEELLCYYGDFANTEGWAEFGL